MIRVSGYSDDGITIDGDLKDSMDTCARDGVHGVIVIGDKAGGCVVRAFYNETWCTVDEGFGCWSLAVSQVDEGCPIPWNVTVRHDTIRGEVGYSTVVDVDCPAGTHVKWGMAQGGDIDWRGIGVTA